MVYGQPAGVLRDDYEGRTLDHVGDAQAGGNTLYQRSLARTKFAVEGYNIARLQTRSKSAAELNRLGRTRG